MGCETRLGRSNPTLADCSTVSTDRARTISSVKHCHYHSTVGIDVGEEIVGDILDPCLGHNHCLYLNEITLYLMQL
jgi:hypothetical protein